MRHVLQHQTRHHAYYNAVSVPTEQTPTKYPVTRENQRTGFRITLPVSSLPIDTPQQAIPHHSTVLQQIKHRLPQYAPELWAKINQAPNQDITKLNQYITEAKHPLIVVSDASLNSQKRSAFSWVISTTSQVLWTGAGTVPGPQRDAYSGRAEGFGLLAAFTFLEQYLHRLPVPAMLPSPKIKGYCDNLGLLQQITKMKTSKTPNPTWTIENDYDLYNEILQTILRIPFATELHHVKGHQDSKNKDEALSYEATLNIECDKCARINLETLPINTNPHPMLPASYPHLRIKDQTIVRQLADYIRENHRLPLYHNYLVKKFKWTNDIPNQIEWGVIELAMRQFKSNDKICIRKMIHEWIPTKISPGNNPSHEQDRLCPTCKRVPETPEHLFQCTSPTRMALRQKLQAQLSTFCTQSGFDPHWYQLWWMGLTHPNEPEVHTINLYPPHLRSIHQNQQMIGWKHLYYG